VIIISALAAALYAEWLPYGCI